MRKEHSLAARPTRVSKGTLSGVNGRKLPKSQSADWHRRLVAGDRLSLPPIPRTAHAGPFGTGSYLATEVCDSATQGRDPIFLVRALC
jgi:hypothetical protein